MSNALGSSLMSYKFQVKLFKRHILSGSTSILDVSKSLNLKLTGLVGHEPVLITGMPLIRADKASAEPQVTMQ
jgi:hypothetical protein